MALGPLARWCWQDDTTPPKWMPYDDQQSAQLEMAAAQGSTEAIIFGGKYRIQFHSRKQLNQHSSFSRNILRSSNVIITPAAPLSYFLITERHGSGKEMEA